MALVSHSHRVALAHHRLQLSCHDLHRLCHVSQICNNSHPPSQSTTSLATPMASPIEVRLGADGNGPIVELPPIPAGIFEEEAKQLLLDVAPELRVVRVETIPYTGAKQAYRITTADGPSMIFTIGPHVWNKPMRFERHCVSAEARLLTYLSSLPPHEVLSRGGGLWDTTWNQPVPSFDHTGQVINLPMPTNFLFNHIPVIVKASFPEIPFFRKQFILTAPTPGRPFSALGQPLSKQDLKSVYWQVGRLMRLIACHASPTGMFGEVGEVLKSDTLLSSYQLPSGFMTWSDAFKGMLEAALQDLEDHSIHVPYQEIRNTYSRLSHLLDKISRPSLVALDGGSASNVLVVGTGGADPIRVTGLQCWNNCIFGDPLLATIFFETSPETFLAGIAEKLGPGDPFQTEAIIEDVEGARARLLIYHSYHALVKIGRQYYHLHSSNATRELEARRELRMILDLLENIGEDGLYTLRNGKKIQPSYEPGK